MIKILSTYSFLGFLQLIYYKVRTKLVFKNARLIRFPIRIRGKKFISVGSGFTTGFNCRIDAYSDKNKKTLEIGDNVQINDFVHIGAIESVKIGNNVLIASKVFISDHSHGNYSGKNSDSPKSMPNDRALHSHKVIIEDNVWIGEFVSILPGVIIGEGSIIGTMSVVNTNIPPYSIAVGSPARVIKKYNFEKKEWFKI